MAFDGQSADGAGTIKASVSAWTVWLSTDVLGCTMLELSFFPGGYNPRILVIQDHGARAGASEEQSPEPHPPVNTVGPSGFVYVFDEDDKWHRVFLAIVTEALRSQTAAAAPRVGVSVETAEAVARQAGELFGRILGFPGRPDEATVAATLADAVADWKTAQRRADEA